MKGRNYSSAVRQKQPSNKNPPSDSPAQLSQRTPLSTRPGRLIAQQYLKCYKVQMPVLVHEQDYSTTSFFAKIEVLDCCSHVLLFASLSQLLHFHLTVTLLKL